MADAPQRKFQFGKAPVRHDARNLKFANYKTGRLRVPSSVPYHKDIAWPMYKNDVYGTCSCAAAAHMIIDWTAENGQIIIPAEADVLAVYRHFTRPGKNNGCPMLDVLRYWRKHGIGKHKIEVFAQLHPRSVAEVKQAIYHFGSAYLGFELPKFLLNRKDASRVSWAERPYGLNRDGAPDPDFGHCVCAVGYDAERVYVVSWGKIKAMTWQFYEDYMDEAYVAFSPDLLKDGRSPSGFDKHQLLADLQAIHKKTEAGRPLIRI